MTAEATSHGAEDEPKAAALARFTRAVDEFYRVAGDVNQQVMDELKAQRPMQGAEWHRREVQALTPPAREFLAAMVALYVVDIAEADRQIGGLSDDGSPSAARARPAR